MIVAVICVGGFLWNGPRLHAEQSSKRQASAPAISPAAGTYSGAITMTLSSDTKNATIRYTLDGSTPTAASPTYASPVALTKSTTVKAFVTAPGMNESTVSQAAFVVNTTTEPAPQPAPTTTTTTTVSSTGALYESTSPWNTTIPVGASIDPNSAAMVQTVTSAAQTGDFLIAVSRWSRPIYFADQTTPKYTVWLSASWAPAKSISGVPIPSGAMPDPAGDGHMTIIDKSTACEYDFWQAIKGSDGSWTASWGNATSAAGNGWYAGGLSATGSGAAGAAGLIRPEELQAGVIRHALAMVYPYTKAGGPVLPATESDGRTTTAGAIPQGARLQLDPTLDLSQLGLKDYELTIARAMQQYGLFLMDSNGGGVSLVAQNPQSSSVAFPWGTQTYVFLPTSLLSRLNVLTLGPQYTPRMSLQPGSCATFQ